MKTRAKFPVRGIYAVRGGVPSSYYLTPADARRYRYARPAEYVQPEAVIADCWIVDRNGHVNPGTNVSPVPFCREVIGRRIG